MAFSLASLAPTRFKLIADAANDLRPVGARLAREGYLPNASDFSAFPVCPATAQTTPRYHHSATSSPRLSVHPVRQPPGRTFPFADVESSLPPCPEQSTYRQIGRASCRERV